MTTGSLTERLETTVSTANEVFDLSGICLNTQSDSDWQSLQESLVALHSTEENPKKTLDLSRCLLNSHDLIVLKDILVQTSVFTSLVISANYDDSTTELLDLTELSLLLAACPGIVSLTLTHNRLSDVSVLARSLQKSLLRSLDLSHNHVSAVHCHALVDMLRSEECGLDTLSLAHNHLDDDVAPLLVKVLMWEKCRLTSLSLAGNHLTTDGAVTLLTCLKTNRHLRSLNVRDNGFSDAESQLIALSSFVTSYRANQNSSLIALEGLDVSNSLRALGAEDVTLPEGFAELPEREKNAAILVSILRSRKDKDSAINSLSESRQDSFAGRERSDSRLSSEGGPTMSLSESINFGKHTPRILRKQLILQLVEHYLGIEGVPTAGASFSSGSRCRPSIQRFHGALLFVDISGFTALSLRLSVEELKNHINEYFSTMLEIVDRHGGDVIKFAGDALFIVWHTDYSQPLDHAAHDSFPLSSYEAVHGTLRDPGDPGHQKVFHEACRTAVEQAVECGREISAKCGNHKVILTQKNLIQSAAATSQEPEAGKGSPSMFRKLLPAMFTGTSRPTSPAVEGAPNEEGGESVAYLNVHSGVSCGLMAGIDIGANDRWEYFLVGEPLSRVACAEGQAKTGDVIVCPESHALLHPAGESTHKRHNARVIRQKSALYVLDSIPEPHASHDGKLASVELLPCGCKPVESGFFCVKQKIISPATNRKSRVKSKLDEAVTVSEHHMSTGGSTHREAMERDIEKGYQLFKSICQCELLSQTLTVPAVAALSQASSTLALPVPTTALSVVERVAGEFGIDPSVFLSAPAAVEEEKLKFPFQKWVVNCLTDDLARHVHQVARNQYTFKDVDRTSLNGFLDRLSRRIVKGGQESGSRLLEHLFQGQHSGDATNVGTPTHVGGGGGGGLAGSTSPLGGRSRASSHDVDEGMSVGSGPDGQSHALHKRTPRNSKVTNKKLLNHEDKDMTAELRSVTVMFVNLDMKHTELVIDANISRQKEGAAPPSCDAYRFLTRTVNEELADRLLLDRLQGCMQVLTQAFADRGGQLRQFIVDDKGTVCIGTFGLRGASSDDNAAAAMETAKMIVDNLRELGLNSSVGVTVGKAFCGLVGSTKRHEYAVMGPSTNLSARLMCKAPPNGILCDFETKNRDRTHDFESQGTIAAKGFAAPVGTFKPLFATVTTSSSLGAFDLYAHDGINAISNALKAVQTGGVAGGLINPDTLTNEQVEAHFKSDNRVLRQMLQSKNYLQEANFNTQMSIPGDSVKAGGGSIQVRSRLHGRRREIESILVFLFNSLVTHGQEGISPSPSESAKINEKFVNPPPLRAQGSGVSVRSQRSSESQPKATVFDVTKPARFVGVVGSQGMGKSTVLSALAQQIFAVVSTDLANNIHLFETRFNSFQAATPFAAWTTVMRVMLARIHRCSVIKPPQETPEQQQQQSQQHGRKRIKRRSMLVGVSNEARDIETGAEYVMQFLPDSLQKYKALLSDMQITAPDRDAVEALKLTAQDRTELGKELLLAIIGEYPKITNNLVFLSVEDTHNFDKSSKALLAEVWSRLCGVVVVFTGRAAQSTTAALTAVTQDLAKRGYQRPLQQTLNIYSGDGESAKDEHNSSAKDGALLSFKGRKGSTGQQLVSDFTDAFVDPDRYYEVEMCPLTRHATDSLVRDILINRGISHVADSLLEKLFHVSSGNPMYACELAKSVVEQNKNTLDAAVVTKAMSAFRSNRLEEVICHRFDQLTSAEQTILKMAAVACSHGGAVSYDALTYIIDDETKLAAQQFEDSAALAEEGAEGDALAALSIAQFVGASNLNLANALVDIVNCDLFLYATPVHQHKAAGSLATISTDDSNAEAALRMKNSRCFVAVEDVIASQYVFRFRVHLEQETIYDLLLDDQKQAIHECVAEFHQTMRIANAKRSIQSRDTALVCKNYADEAYHFLHAAQWSAAMCASYNAAVLEKREAKKRKHLNTARSMYLLIKQQCEVDDHPDDHHPLHSNSGSPRTRRNKRRGRDATGSPDRAYTGGDSDKQSTISSEEADACLMKLSELEHLFAATFNTPANPSSGANSGNASVANTATGSASGDAHALTLDKIFQIFNGDVELLMIGINLHVQLIQQYTNTLHNDEPLKTQQVIEETLQMLCLCKNPFLFNSAHFANIIQSIENQRMRGSRDEGDHDEGKENELAEYFCVRDFYSLCFPVLSAYVQNHASILHFNGNVKAKLSFLVKHYLHMSLHMDTLHLNNVVVNPTGEAASTSLTVYYIQAINDAITAAMKDNQTEHAVLYCRELVKIYDYTQHSADLILIYGVDRVPQTLAVVAQCLLMEGKLQECTVYLNLCVAISRQMTSRSSIVVGIYAICSTLVALKRHGEALSLFEHYLYTKKCDASTRNDIVDEVDNIFVEWLRRLVRFDAYLVTRDGALFRDDSLDIDELMQQGASSLVQHNKADSGIRPYLYDQLCCQGFGMEAILLDLCVMKIIVLEGSNPAATLERRSSQAEFASEKTAVEDASMVLVKSFEVAAQSYLHFTLAMTSTNSHQLLLNKTNALMSHLQLLHSDNFNAKKMLSDASGGHMVGPVPQRHFSGQIALTKMKETAGIYQYHLASALVAIYAKQSSHYMSSARRAESEAEEAIPRIAEEACEGLSSDADVRMQLLQAALILVPIKERRGGVGVSEVGEVSSGVAEKLHRPHK